MPRVIPNRILGLVLAGTGSSAQCIDRDFRNLRKRLPARLRARLARQEKAGIFQPDGAYKKDYAAASAQALAPYMYEKPPPARFKHTPPLGMDVLARDVGASLRFSHRWEPQGF